MKRCANACSEVHPLQLRVRRRLAVRPRLARTKFIQEKVEAEEKVVAEEEITAKRGILRRHRAILDIISTIQLARLSQMHHLDREVAVLSLNGTAPTLKLLSNRYAALGALIQVEEVASISIVVLEEAKVHVTNISSLQNNGHLLSLRILIYSLESRKALSCVDRICDL